MTLTCRSAFISDVHLGYPSCRADFLLAFLRALRCERLYLVGDIVDLENMAKRPYWHPSHGEVVAEILAMAARGVRVTYIPGNHDAPLRRFAGQRIAGIEVARDAVHVGADGRRWRVTHGDEFDGAGDTPRWLVSLGDRLQGLVCVLNRCANALMRRCGLGYRPLSVLLKLRIGAASRFIREFEQRVAERAARDGFDGHICGHIHCANLREHAGVVYLNDGDWVEHCTGLVEHVDGGFELVHWTERRLCLARNEAQVSGLPLATAA